jgi:hypothetical protein
MGKNNIHLVIFSSYRPKYIEKKCMDAIVYFLCAMLFLLDNLHCSSM